MSSESEDNSVDLNKSETESDGDVESESQIDEDLEGRDLDKSATDSNETDNEDHSDNESLNDQQNDAPKTADDLLREKIANRYKERQGKQLYLRFPEKLPEDEKEFQKKVLALSPLIIKAHKPRQKHARFCLVDFNTQNDRDAAMKNIRNNVKKDESFKGIVVSIPHTESEGFVQALIAKKLKSVESKRAKARLKRATKQAKRTKQFTSTILVHNLPSNVSMVELRNLFPNAVDIQKKQFVKNKETTVANITLPSSIDARKAVQRELSFEGTPLKINFCLNNKRKDSNKNIKNLNKKTKQNQKNKKTIKKNEIKITPRIRKVLQ